MTNEETITNYLNELTANGMKPATIVKERATLSLMCDHFTKPFEELTKHEIVEFILTWNKEDRIGRDGRHIINISDATKATRKAGIKKFMKWLGNEKAVSDIKVKMPQTKVTADTVLTLDDVNSLIDNTPSHYYRALIALLWETGGRIGEITALRKKDFNDTESGMIVTITTYKTETHPRKMLLLSSAQYIRNLFMYADIGADDQVFSVQKTARNEMLKKIGKRAGIKKPISPHKFRHGQATQMVKLGYQEAIIRRKMGWTPTSPMIATYQHLNDTDVIDATLIKEGQEVIEKPVVKEMVTAEKVTIADTNEIIRKQTEEINELREAQKRSDKLMEAITELLKIKEQFPEL